MRNPDRIDPFLERWKEIPDTYYEVSNKGNIRNLKTKRLSKQYTTSTSDRLYVKVRTKGNKKFKHLNVAREVAKAFLPKIKGKEYVNHKDGNKHNNNANNLEWCTRSENEKHAFANNLKTPTRGEKSGMAKLKWEDIDFIRENHIPYNHNFSIRALSKRFNVCKTTIENILNNKTWIKEYKNER